MRKIGEEMFPVDLSLQAKETVKAHLCLCTWQPADLCTHGHRGIIIFSIGCGSGFISLFGACSNVHFFCFQTDGTDGIVFCFFFRTCSQCVSFDIGSREQFFRRINSASF